MEKLVKDQFLCKVQSGEKNQLTAGISIKSDGFWRARQVEDDQLGLVGPADDGLVETDRRVHATDVVRGLAHPKNVQHGVVHVFENTHKKSGHIPSGGSGELDPWLGHREYISRQHG